MRKYVAGTGIQPGPLALESDMLPTVLCSPASVDVKQQHNNNPHFYKAELFCDFQFASLNGLFSLKIGLHIWETICN